MTCKYRVDDTCVLAGILANTEPTPVTDDHCTRCSREVNLVTIDLAIKHLEVKYPRSRLKNHLTLLFHELGSGNKKTSGPGTLLKNILSWFSTEGCDCSKYAQVMDAWGPEVCEQNIEQIIGWLRKSANDRKLPFWEAPVRQVVLFAIRNG